MSLAFLKENEDTLAGLLLKYYPNPGFYCSYRYLNLLSLGIDIAC